MPAIIPTSGWGYQWANGPDWTSTIALVPWQIYLFYGDATLLERSYDNIRNYVDYITSISPTGICYWGLGDWVPVKSKSPVELTSTAYYYTDVMVLSKAAGLLGKKADQEKYARLASDIKQAFNDKFLNEATGIYAEGHQTELSVPLYWDLVPDELRSKVAANLAKQVEADNFHLDVGLLGSKAILGALSENGFAEVAYKVASQETYPSWGWWMVNGATTLLENWDINAKTDISRNHIMFGEVGSWFFEALGGINPDEQQPGFKHVSLNPHFVKGLDHFNVNHQSIRGEISSSWKRVKKRIEYEVVIPANSTASLVLDKKAKYQGGALSKQIDGDQAIFQLTSGSYNFIIQE